MTAKEALEVLIDNLEYPCDKEYDIVWNALNRLERLDNLMIEKGINVNSFDSFITDLGDNSKRLEELEKDFEWLKSKINFTFLDSLGYPEDRIKLAKIMGYEIEGY